MAPAFEESKDAIARLVKYFATNREQYCASDYKEAHARQEFIDPLFAALGWDVANTKQAAPNYREVVVEDSLEIEGQTKAPDYAFRVGRERKFFAEAKKPGVDLKSDARPAYQLRRYAWTAKLPLSLLTDFDELAVYDCRVRPSEKDKASAARVNYLTFAEYPDRWREVWDVFSREAVWAGSFDQYAETGKGRRGTSTVDAEFLKEIEGWREALAKNIALRNPRLTIDEMNDAVQRTIDRIIFLRMAEDRGIEEYGRLQRLAERQDIYAGLLALSRQADARYNSGLFDFSRAGDKITPALTVEDKALKPILADLYYPQSPYEFSVLPAQILGNVYEQFLGKVIRLTAAHQAKVEEKPEVKKAGGVYYTPTYIVEYIVKHTVGKKVEGKSPRQLKGFRVVDMASGSGSFLLGAYQFLLEYYQLWYAEHDPQKHAEAVWQKGELWRLTTAEKKRILVEHIFGVDIDRQAVEVTKLSLLLKVLEGESDESLGKQLALFHERALPNLDRNIKCGNSLIGPDYFSGQLLPDAEELRRVNPFDWAAEFPEATRAGGFDCVIGNPPYGASISASEEQFLRKQFETSTKDLDTYPLFMERSIRLCRPLGRVSMIVPTGWYSGPKFSMLRRFVATSTDSEVFINLPYDVFDAWVDTSVFVVVVRKQRTPWLRKEACEVQLRTFPKRHRIRSASEFEEQLASAEMTEWFTTGSDEFLTYADKQSTLLIRKIQAISKPLGHLADVQRGVTPFELTESRTHPRSQLAFDGTVRRYMLDRGPKRYIRFDDTLAELKPERYFVGPRLLLRELISRQFRLQAVKATGDFVTNKSMQSILQLPDAPELNYLLGIINSRLMSWYFLSRSNIAQRDDFPKIVLKETRSLPICSIDFSDPADKSRHDRMVTLVEQMLDLHKRKAGAKDAAGQERLQRLIDSMDKQIDALVYELYGLTPEEIAVVENPSE
jgi:type I restriction-modification system DNA methylase subunit